MAATRAQRAVGNYSVSVAKDGFQPQQQKGIDVAVGQSTQVNFTISVSRCTKKWSSTRATRGQHHLAATSASSTSAR